MTNIRQTEGRTKHTHTHICRSNVQFYVRASTKLTRRDLYSYLFWPPANFSYYVQLEERKKFVSKKNKKIKK